jgi:GDP-L-fucose synthase
MRKDAKIYVAGHRGLVGSAILRNLVANDYTNLVLRSHEELDLIETDEVQAFFNLERPEYVFLSAAKVGGIWANSTFPAEFIYDNLMIQTNVIHAAYRFGVKKLLFLGSSCIYPRDCPQPIKEEYLLSGKLEQTNEPYAIAKIAGIKMCQAYNHQYGTRFVCAMPTNLYGPGDSFDLENSHVLPALIRKFHEGKAHEESGLASQGMAKPVTIWGTGNPRREFLHVDDFADALLFIMQHQERYELINIGVGKDISIRELGNLIRKIIGYEGDVQFDQTKPDGTPRKLLDVSRLKGLGWQSKIPLEEGISRTYQWYLNKELKKTRP